MYCELQGLSSFYSELMKGFGAGTRLWELMERKPEFPLNGKYHQTTYFVFLLKCYVGYDINTYQALY